MNERASEWYAVRYARVHKSIQKQQQSQIDLPIGLLLLQCNVVVLLLLLLLACKQARKSTRECNATVRFIICRLPFALTHTILPRSLLLIALLVVVVVAFAVAVVVLHLVVSVQHHHHHRHSYYLSNSTTIVSFFSPSHLKRLKPIWLVIIHYLAANRNNVLFRALQLQKKRYLLLLLVY